MIELYDVVRATKDLIDKVPKNTIGTIVVIFPDFPTGYMVEFFTDDYLSLDVLTITAEDFIWVSKGLD